MRQINMSYARAEACFYEAMRIIKGASEWTAEKEGNALIDPERTPDNFEVMPHHSALNPSVAGKNNRGQGIAEYHKSVTGRGARMNGQEDQLSKAIGCIATLPKDYLAIDYGLTEKEYLAVAHHIENEETNEPNSLYYHSAMEKVRNYRYTAEEKEKMKVFFAAFLKAWMKVADIRTEDLLFAVVHLDETFPHIHVMALPTIQDPETGKVTFSTSKYNNRVTHYYDTLHTRVIQEMAVLDIDGSGLLNGATKERSFNPADFNRDEREKGTKINIENIILQKRNEMLKEAKEYAEADFLWAESQMDDKEAELSEIEEKKQETSDDVSILSSVVKSARQEVDFLRAEREEIADQINEYRKEMYSETLSEKEFKQRQKELLKACQKGKTVVLQPEEYERLLHNDLLASNLRRREEMLQEDKKNLKKKIQEGISKRFPEELQKIAEEKEYWLTYSQEWEQYAEETNERVLAVNEKEIVLAQKEQEINEREENLLQKEKDLDLQIERYAEEKFQQKKLMFLEKVKALVHLLISAIVEILTLLIPIPFKHLLEPKVMEFMDDLESIFSEKEIEVEEQEQG